MKKLLFISSTVSILFMACQSGNHDDGHGHLMDKISSQKKELSFELTYNNLIDTTTLLKVHPELEGVNSFFISNRNEEITSFPCNNCHTKPLKSLQAGSNSDTKKSHWNIHLEHANENTMACVTCHSEKNMNQLNTIAGQNINMNESYKLCAQCHSTQYKDWQGGAHGKEANGWATPRVAKSCVECHNPHKPAFPTRFPARLNTHDLNK